MKSVSLVEYQPGDGERNDRLTEAARHLQVSWSTALAEVKENTYLQADAEGNLTLLERDVSGVTAEDQRRLVPRGDMRLGEQVNRMRRVDVAIATDAPVIPKAFLATVSELLLSSAVVSNKTNTIITGRRLHLPLRAHRALQNRPPPPPGE